MLKTKQVFDTDVMRAGVAVELMKVGAWTEHGLIVKSNLLSLVILIANRKVDLEDCTNRYTINVDEIVDGKFKLRVLK